jgi:hypothetical protein
MSGGGFPTSKWNKPHDQAASPYLTVADAADGRIEAGAGIPMLSTDLYINLGSSRSRASMARISSRFNCRKRRFAS